VLAGVVGSGIMAAQPAGAGAAPTLFINAAATAASLYVLIATLQPVCGAPSPRRQRLALAARRTERRGPRTPDRGRCPCPRTTPHAVAHAANRTMVRFRARLVLGTAIA